MELFVQVSFWATAFVFVWEVGNVGLGKYPHQKTTTLNDAIAMQLLRLGFMAWMGILLWG